MNRERFKQVLDYIKANPDKWDQRHYGSHYGGGRCFIGIAQSLTGTTTQGGGEWLDLTEEEFSYMFNYRRTINDFEEFLETGIIPRR